MRELTQSTKLKPEEFSKLLYPYAKGMEDKTGISAYAILAQAALESGWNERSPGWMYFGVKATNWTGLKQLLRTKEYHKNPHVWYPEVISVTPLSNGMFKYIVKDWFRAYSSPEECFIDHARLFLELNRYQQALEVGDNPYKFVQEIARAGYATDPKYADKLIKIINMIKNYV